LLKKTAHFTLLPTELVEYAHDPKIDFPALCTNDENVTVELPENQPI
jgi:hypothetical protein